VSEPDDADRKSFATMAAQAALAGHQLERQVTERGAVLYRAARWGWSRSFDILDAVEDWLAGVAGRRVA
jgi:hypothetical protein